MQIPQGRGREKSSLSWSSEETASGSRRLKCVAGRRWRHTLSGGGGRHKRRGAGPRSSAWGWLVTAPGARHVSAGTRAVTRGVSAAASCPTRPTSNPVGLPFPRHRPAPGTGHRHETAGDSGSSEALKCSDLRLTNDVESSEWPLAPPGTQVCRAGTGPPRR